MTKLRARKCVVCGIAMKVAHPNRCLCSAACIRIRVREYQRLNRINNLERFRARDLERYYKHRKHILKLAKIKYAAKRGELAKRNCITCGSEFDVRTNQKSCSPECGEKHDLQRRKEYNRLYRIRNLERIRGYERKRKRDSAKSKQYSREWHAKNKDYAMVRSLQYRIENREKINQHAREKARKDRAILQAVRELELV